jgi:tripartite-type tricarboxylate transporter receptor subunit TctC
MSMKIQALGLFVLLIWPFASINAQSNYPMKPITVIVPYAAGGPMDKLAREISEPLRLSLGQPIIIQNTVGAGGNVGTASAQRAPNDGYSLLFNHIGMATAPSLYKNLAFSPDADFEPLGLFVESPLVLVARPQIPTESMVDLVRWIAKQPQVKLGNAGIGSASHLCGLLIQSSLQTNLTTVPYKGTAPALTDLLGGHIDLMCDLTANVLPHIASGKLKAIGVTSPKALANTKLYKVPTLATFGMSNVQLSVWYGMYAPKNTSLEIREQLSEALRKATRSDSFRKAQATAGVQLIEDNRLSAQGHKIFLAAEIARWKPIIKAAGTYAE